MVRQTRTACLIVVLSLTVLGTTNAAEPYCQSGWWNTAIQPNSACQPCCVVQFAICCDDYCRKPCPRIPCRPTQVECDDYCRRPEPCVPRPCVTCVDDYCRKPFPKTCWPVNAHVQCIPYCEGASGPEGSAPSESGPPQPMARAPRVLWIR